MGGGFVLWIPTSQINLIAPIFVVVAAGEGWGWCGGRGLEQGEAAFPPAIQKCTDLIILYDIHNTVSHSELPKAKFGNRQRARAARKCRQNQAKTHRCAVGCIFACRLSKILSIRFRYHLEGRLRCSTPHTNVLSLLDFSYFSGKSAKNTRTACTSDADNRTKSRRQMRPFHTPHNYSACRRKLALYTINPLSARDSEKKGGGRRWEGQ